VLVVSQRRRILKLIEEESKAADAVTDEHAKDHILKALRATTARYQDIAWRPPVAKAKRRMRTIGIPCVIVATIAFLVAYRSEELAESEHTQDVVQYVAQSVATLSWIVMLAAFLALSFAQMDARDESKALKASRHKAARLRASNRAMVESASDLQRLIEASQGTATGRFDYRGTASGVALDVNAMKAFDDWLKTVDHAKAALDSEVRQQGVRRRVKERRRRFREFEEQHGRPPTPHEKARIYNEVAEEDRVRQEGQQPTLDLGIDEPRVETH
jgi:hypothetical protein